MKISPLNNQYFKGHAAGRIKALYMQNPGNQSQLAIYNQMREIGKAEGCHPSARNMPNNV